MRPGLCTLANTAWLAQGLPAVRRFERALRNPAATQGRLLQQHLRMSRGTAWGRSIRLDRVDDQAGFRQRIPLQTYHDLQPWIERIAAGEPAVLTHEPVTRLIPTSGSTSAIKLIPYTAGLQQQFNAAIRAWIFDLCRQFPKLRNGPAYWSISPAMQIALTNSGKVPIGFDDDTAYLGRLGRRLVNATLAVPNSVRHQHDLDEFRFATLWWLLRARSLRLVSVWHPTFWSLLFERLEEWWEPLLRGLATGRCERRPGSILATAPPLPRQSVTRLERLGPKRPDRLWPDLTVISAWGDASAAGPFQRLVDQWPSVHHQPKGLLSTEAFVSLPYRQTHPAAVTSHVIEWLDDDGRVHTLERAEVNGEYEPVVTAANGFCRYRTGDRVRITGHLYATPTVQFLGRGDRVSDLCGEKLTEAFVMQAVAETLSSRGLSAAFSILTPAAREAPTHYTWWIQGDGAPFSDPDELAAALEQRLAANLHYSWARRLGQLGPVVVHLLSPSDVTNLLRKRAGDQPLGGVKLGILGRNTDHAILQNL